MWNLSYIVITLGRLEGMFYEAQGNWQQADKVYSDILEQHPSDAVTFNYILLLRSIEVVVFLSYRTNV